MRSSSSGLLLLLVAVLGLVGFLTGNLDRWTAWLFDPTRPPLGASPAGSSPAASSSPAQPQAAPASALVSVGSTTTRQTA